MKKGCFQQYAVIRLQICRFIAIVSFSYYIIFGFEKGRVGI